MCGREKRRKRHFSALFNHNNEEIYICTSDVNSPCYKYRTICPTPSSPTTAEFSAPLRSQRRLLRTHTSDELLLFSLFLSPSPVVVFFVPWCRGRRSICQTRSTDGRTLQRRLFFFVFLSSLSSRLSHPVRSIGARVTAAGPQDGGRAD